MNSAVKNLLIRWQSLEHGDGLQRATSVTRALRFVRLVLCIGVVLAVIYRIHPAIVAISGAVLGWVVAETNALRNRLEQWPVFRAYIDWKRVEDDLKRTE